MSSVVISSDLLQNISNDSSEIRLRTLEQIAVKLNRAADHNEKVALNATDLCRQLIRWFSFKPLNVPLKVLGLLRLILQNDDYGGDILRNIGAERLFKELDKIRHILKGHQHELKATEVIQTLKLDIKQKTENISQQNNVEDVSVSLQNLCLEDQLPKGYSIDDFEIPWSRPSSTDYSTLKLLTDSLSNTDASKLEIQSALQHLQLTMCDYPVEYLLQAPHIFHNLLQIFNESVGENKLIYSMNHIENILLEFLTLLSSRLKLKNKSIAQCIPRTETLTTKFLGTKASSSNVPSQLRMENALNSLLVISIENLERHIEYGQIKPEIWEIVYTIFNTFKYLNMKINSNIIHKIVNIINKFNFEFNAAEKAVSHRLWQVHFSFLLHEIVNVNGAENLFGIQCITILLKDYVLKNLFPKHYQRLYELINKSNESLIRFCKQLEDNEKAYRKAITYLINTPKCYEEIVLQGLDIYSILDKLCSKCLIDILFNAVINCNHLLIDNPELNAAAKKLILKLLQLTYMPLRLHVYEQLALTFKRHIGCLMTGESFSTCCSNSVLLKAHIVGIPLSPELFIHLLHESMETTEEAIRNNCFDILAMLLKSQNLFESHWDSILSSLLTLFPLMTCCTISEKLMSLLNKFYDPDHKQLPFINLLKGNIVLLFHKNDGHRSEALTRLVYIINSVEDAKGYLPNILEISDTLPNDLCFMSTTVEQTSIFKDCVAMDPDAVSTLNNLLYILDCSDVEPLIRKNTLMQLDVLCSNWLVVAEVCHMGAYYLILKAIDNALQKDSSIYYPDSAAPAISILVKILMHDAELRCQLSEAEKIYTLLLRTLMMFVNDIQLRRNASICLFLLLFSSHLVVTKHAITAPYILGYIQSPLTLNLCSGINADDTITTNDAITAAFSSVAEENRYWRFVIADAFNGGLNKISPHVVEKQMVLDISSELKLTPVDVRWIRCSQPSEYIQRALRSSSNATNHESLIKNILLLKQHLVLNRFICIMDIDSNRSNELNNLLGKYLQMTPVNEKDFDLYEHLIDVTVLAVKSHLLNTIDYFLEALQKDPQYGMVSILTENNKITLQLFYKVSALLRVLIRDHGQRFQQCVAGVELKHFLSNLFDRFYDRLYNLFKKRDLQRSRCLLALLLTLSTCELNFTNEKLTQYSKYLINLSIALKSFSQTGAQWHKDCLLTMLQLTKQMDDINMSGHFNTKNVKYFSGLCGHSDAQVRTLAWSALNFVAKIKKFGARKTKTEENSEYNNGAELLRKELAYLPGGFLACCLCTLSDKEELTPVRQLAGELFISLIRIQSEAEQTMQNELILLEKYQFMSSALESVKPSICILSEKVPESFNYADSSISNCELISCYTTICIELSLRSKKFRRQLYSHPFAIALYEIIKQSIPQPLTQNYFCMFSDICRFYTLCYPNNFELLQRTLCRDLVWLSCFCKILFDNNIENLITTKELVVVDILQMLIVLCKDKMAFEQILHNILQYSVEFTVLFKRAFSINFLKTPLQTYALSALNILLIKCQLEVNSEANGYLVTFLEKPVPSLAGELDINKTSTMEKDRNKEGDVNNESTGTVAEHIVLTLIRLYLHVYPLQVCKFTMPPTDVQQQISETLALLLKVSPVAQRVAKNLRLNEKILKILKYFLDEFGTTSCSTYIRRHGENKKSVIIKNLNLVFTFMLHWHSSQMMVITDALLAENFAQTLLQLWQWFTYSADLRLTVLNLCAFLTERSFVICKQFSSLNLASSAHSVLQLTIKIVINETSRVKANTTEGCQLPCAGLRVLMNCCSGSEGRIALQKSRVIDIIDTIHPFNSKGIRLKEELVSAWLRFWELYSRYEDSAQACHLSAICYVINRCEPRSENRLLLLQILRNMTFLSSNRTTLMTSKDFLYTVDEVLSQPTEYLTNYTFEEHLTVCVGLWKLLAGGVKYVAMVRGTKLAKRLKLLNETLQNLSEEENLSNIPYAKDLLKVLEIIFQILNK